MRAYVGGVVLFGIAFVVVGVLIVVRTALAGGGVGFLLGPLFCALGAARLYMALRRR